MTEEPDQQKKTMQKGFQLGNRRMPLSNNLLMLLNDLLQPQTTGFDFVNGDMTFTYMDRDGIAYVKNTTVIITFCAMYGLKKPLYIERSNLATHLNIYKSLNGKSMELFTSSVSTQKHEFTDKTIKKTGFTTLFGKKEANA